MVREQPTAVPRRPAPGGPAAGGGHDAEPRRPAIAARPAGRRRAAGAPAAGAGVAPLFRLLRADTEARRRRSGGPAARPPAALRAFRPRLPAGGARAHRGAALGADLLLGRGLGGGGRVGAHQHHAALRLGCDGQGGSAEQQGRARQGGADRGGRKNKAGGSERERTVPRRPAAARPRSGATCIALGEQCTPPPRRRPAGGGQRSGCCCGALAVRRPAGASSPLSWKLAARIERAILLLSFYDSGTVLAGQCRRAPKTLFRHFAKPRARQSPTKRRALSRRWRESATM